MSEFTVALLVTLGILAALFLILPCQMHLEKRCQRWREKRRQLPPAIESATPIDAWRRPGA